MCCVVGLRCVVLSVVICFFGIAMLFFPLLFFRVGYRLDIFQLLFTFHKLDELNQL